MRISNARFVLPLVAVVALAACKRDNETTTTTTTPSTPAPTTQPATPPATQPATPPASQPIGTPGATTAVSVTALDLGNAVGADNRVANPLASFARTDTIYAAVTTSGAAPSSTIAARWTYQDGQVVGEESKTVAPNGSDVTTFSVSKPDGWPAGKYKVEVMVDGQVAATREFDVM